MMMKQLTVLIRREFWENRGIFLVLPALITTFILLILILGAVLSASYAPNVDVDIKVQIEGDVEFLDDLLIAGHLYEYVALQLDALSMDERERYLNAGMLALGAPLLFCLWAVIFFYLLGCLYGDRKDRSILFWKSLPVSDTLTVTSKLVTAILVVPLVYLLGVVLLQLTALLFVSFSTAGTDISAYDIVWQPAGFLSGLLKTLGLLLFSGLWMLPAVGWLLAVSAFAKSTPLVFAIGIPLVVSIAERILTGGSLVGAWMGLHTTPIGFLDQHRSIAENVMANLFSLQMLSALVVGGSFITLAIWLRGKADEI